MIHHYVLMPDSELSLNNINDNSNPALPYILPPFLNETVSSSVRFFGRSEITVSPFGTALWLDSEGGEDSSDVESPMYGYTPTSAGSGSGYSDVGERIAGKRLGLKEQLLDSSVTDLVQSPSSASAGGLDSTRKTPLPSLFASRCTESWYAIDLDEEAGRVAVGGTNGLVEVWDYS